MSITTEVNSNTKEDIEKIRKDEDFLLSIFGALPELGNVEADVSFVDMCLLLLIHYVLCFFFFFRCFGTFFCLRVLILPCKNQTDSHTIQ